MASFFPGIKELPPDPLFGLKARYTADSRADKVDLGIGAYRDENGKPWILPAVRQAEAKLVASPDYNHEYLSIGGYEPFVKEAAKIILGEDSLAIKEGRIVSQQSLSGTGALHLTGLFLKTFYSGEHTIYLSKPTWANHNQIFTSVGFKVESYPYWNNETKSLDLDGFLNAIRSAPKKSVFLLHACAHNPTGLDPTQSQWTTILKELDNNNHLVLFDSAYQGFASGNLEKDGFAIRHAINDKLINSPIIICQSFAKNCGMYGERVGAVHVITPPGATGEAVAPVLRAIKSQLNKIIRSELSNPPAYGAKIVAAILSDKDLKKQWQDDLTTMSSRIIKMRHSLRDLLTNELKTPGNWDHIVNQTGMFSFTGLTPEMVARLEEKHGVYLVSSGRASVAGLNEGNINKVAQAIDEVVRSCAKPKL
ncbi:aspartate aminotransferase [Suhomyces tanzawaensis NRRL Y-17324]|uniref:Aspartate aminotransferase n=1 Tax=Suhomyces tanzawaensis NRRL Y-17324 TaxID=984487 RepID=A0A1E4SL89_9ASCO|nr:aspartate aminotransferase [Suhomyces tanzawaensis NRRL Y-17324]ODV80264.1 aspartate aminotransferase [Suhomyces tanzawaensis NRRL Y-17324]